MRTRLGTGRDVKPTLFGIGYVFVLRVGRQALQCVGRGDPGSVL